MSSNERLILKGSIAETEAEARRLRLQVKGAAALVRGALSPYAMLHLEEISLEELEANCQLLFSALRQLRQREAELRELEG